MINMKRTFFNAFRAVVCAAAAVFMSSAVTGCGSKNDEPDVVKVLKVSTSNLNLEGKATTGTVDVTATGVNWTAVAKDSWVTVTPASGSADAAVTVAAEANPSQADSRFTTVTFSADGVPSVNVTVFQDAAPEPEPEPEPEPDPDQNKTMQYAQFVYYGDALGTQGRCEVVVLSLVDKKVVNNEVELPFDEVDFALVLPYAGSVDAIQSSLFGTFNGVSVESMTLPFFALEASGYSRIYGTGDDDQYDYKALSGTVTVASAADGVKIDFDLKLEGGRTYKGTYTGNPTLADGTQQGGGYWTNLTSDYTPVLTSAAARVTNVTDKSGQEVTNDCGLALVQMRGASDILSFQLFIDYADIAGKDISGTYNCLPSDVTEYKDALNTFMPGEIDVDDEGAHLYPSIYYSVSGQNLQNYAVLEGGSVKFTKGTGNSYTIEVDCKDRENHAIKGTYTLDMPVTDYAASSASVMSEKYSVKMPKAVNSAFVNGKPLPELRRRAF